MRIWDLAVLSYHAVYTYFCAKRGYICAKWGGYILWYIRIFARNGVYFRENGGVYLGY